MTGGDEEIMKELHEKYKKVKGQLGGMKLETGRAAMSEFFGLVAKLYSYQTVDEDGELSGSIKGKGVPKSVLRSTYEHEDFKKMLLDPHKDEVTFKAMRSKKLQNEHLQLSKRGLTAYNDKVFQISATENGPLGHRLNRASPS